MERIELPEAPEVDDFEERMATARKLLDEKGRYVGLCPACFDTKKAYKREGKFWGIEYRKDGENLQFIKCTCGQDVATEYNF